MKRALLILALVAGLACGQWACRSVAFRDAIGTFCGRGHLLALAHGEGIYDADLHRTLAELHYASGMDEKDRDRNIKERSILTRLISNAMAQSLAGREKLSAAQIERELNLLRWQFRDDTAWRTCLRGSTLSARSLRRTIANDLRARRWILRQIGRHVHVTADECRRFYNTHPQSFLQPVRLRASHLFLAAPPETPPEIVDAKRIAIESFSARLACGENFAELVAEASEDEATKERGGDLGYFSAFRMPADFFAEAMRLQVGQISQPICTRLGFHIIELTDLKPARQMTFDEARAEIALVLENRDRQVALEKLYVDLCGGAQWLRSLYW